MNVNEMSKLDLEKALIAGEKDPELKHQILNNSDLGSDEDEAIKSNV